jgi:hypothetical protein
VSLFHISEVSNLHGQSIRTSDLTFSRWVFQYLWCIARTEIFWLENINIYIYTKYWLCNTNVLLHSSCVNFSTVSSKLLKFEELSIKFAQKCSVSIESFLLVQVINSSVSFWSSTTCEESVWRYITCDPAVTFFIFNLLFQTVSVDAVIWCLKSFKVFSF